MDCSSGLQSGYNAQLGKDRGNDVDINYDDEAIDGIQWSMPPCLSPSNPETSTKVRKVDTYVP